MDERLFAAQVRAARGLLGWSQSHLADAIGIARSTLADVESAKREPHSSTIFVLTQELADAGIEFTALGVQFREYPPKPYMPVRFIDEND